jgi:hypothetical protein
MVASTLTFLMILAIIFPSAAVCFPSALTLQTWKRTNCPVVKGFFQD